MLCALTIGQRIASAIAAARPRYCQSHGRTVCHDRCARACLAKRAHPSRVLSRGGRARSVRCAQPASWLAGWLDHRAGGVAAAAHSPEILEVSKLDTRGHRVRWAVDGVEQLRHA